MSWLKRKREPSPNPGRDQATGPPRFVVNETKPDGTVYETYRAADAETAKAFLMTKRVDQGLYYIVVETPQGNWGTDIEGLYLEKLLPWQFDTSAADCVGRITAVASVTNVATAARVILDNFVAQVQCGRCGQLWRDGLRYRDSTLVLCPHCTARNSVDSSGIIVSIRPGQRTVLTTAHDIAVEKPEDNQADPDPEAAMVGTGQALAAARNAADATPPGHPHRPGRLYQLGCGLEERFKRTGELADLDAAISAFSEAADSTPPGDAGLSAHTLAASRTLSARFEHTGKLADLDAAIAASRAALAALPAAAPELPRLLSTLGLALRDRFERTSRLTDLDDAVAVGRDSVAADPEGRPSYLINLSATLRVRFEHTGRREDLDEAIAAGHAAADATGAGHPDHFACCGTLGLAMQERYTATGNLADLDAAVTLFVEAAAGATSPDHPHYSGQQHNLGRALLARFQRTGQLADLDGSVAAASRATAAVATDDPNRARHASQFGHALVARFERIGDQRDLDKGITVLRQAAADTPPGHSDHALHLSIIGNALLARFRRTGQLGDLSEAIDAIRDAAGTTPDDHPDRPQYLDTLGVALQYRFGRTGHLADLDAAIAAGRQAAGGVAPGHARYQWYLSNLGCALQARFAHGSRPADLDEAVTAFRDAIAATPSDHSDIHGLRTNLGSALSDRFKRDGEMADLDEAIDAYRQAVAGTPSDHPWHLTQVHNLSHGLRTRYERTGTADDLDEALATARTAVAATPSDHPRRAAHLNNLGIIRSRQYEHTGDAADLDKAIAVYRDAANAESAPSSERIRAARLWGHAAADAGRLDSAADGLAAAVRLLPQVAWHGSARATREERVAEMSGLASDAAACAIRAGRREQAVEVLESGRSVLWTQLLDLRTDLTGLAEREPDLARRLDQIRTVLDALPPAQPGTPGPVPDADPVERLRGEQSRAAAERMRLAGEFDDLVRQIRGTVAGFEYFLQPVPFAELRSAASGGTAVIVNTSRYGCHALLVSSTGVRAVELSSLTREKAIAQANALLGIVTRDSGPNRPFLDRERDRHAVLDILAWLWDTVAGPVLTELGYTRPPAPGTVPPRIWWCPVGRLALLPLHAAGHHPRHQHGDPVGTDTVPDRVISSYAPTLSALLRACSVPAPVGRPALLAIGMPTTPGADDLPAVPDELDRINARYPIATRLQSPAPGAAHDPEPDPGGQPTTIRVLEELPRHSWVHFSCHGSQHFSDPDESAFWLTDGPLTVADLIRQDAESRELAFLSACQTSAGGLKTVDEAIHLASTMQLLGYRHVIATLWSIYDSLMPVVADTVYTALATAGAPGAARALHQAVAALRAQRPTDPMAWAPYLHIGP